MDITEITTTGQQVEADDLSITLVERRKRLHVLATEINNWEDQETKNPNYFETMSMPPHNPNAPSTSILSFDRSLSTNNNNSCHNIYSPKTYNKSPSINQQPCTNNNKENTKQIAINSPLSTSKRKLSETSTSTTNEILNVAHRILNKNQSNSAMGITQPKVMKAGESLSTGAIRNIKSRFENNHNQNKSDSSNAGDVSILMTPKSIIKKFEQMSNPNAAQAIRLKNKTSSSSLDSKDFADVKQVASIFPSLSSLRQNAEQANHAQRTDKIPSSNHIYSEHIHPKSIIQKFEQLVKNNGQCIQSLEAETITSMPKSISTGTNFSDCRGSGSLTYISSVVSDSSPVRDFEDEESSEESDSDEEEEEEEDVNDQTYKGNHTETDDLYEELSSHQNVTQREIVSATFTTPQADTSGDNTSLFEEEEEETTTTTSESRTDNPETYSLSSSYSGSCLNKDFDDIEDQHGQSLACDEHNENEHADNTDIYSDFTGTDGHYQISSTASYSPGESEFNEYHVDIEPIPSSDNGSDDTPHNNSAKKSLISLLPSKSPVSFNTISRSLLTTDTDTNTEPLYSIKEYRKQKKHAASGLPASSYRRSSVSTACRNGNGSRDTEGCAEKLKKALQTRQQAEVAQQVVNTEDREAKKAKYLERIKELEELIKQEENVIHQTGIALERCLTDSLFTGSSEHIECNRILLISCQKRQAYSSEISRLKQLISILINKKPVQPVKPATVDEFSGYSDSASSVDLTGLLIFSDLQLPIKESYLNKLKSGDEKRIFYFLCLIRNGIQVLQTQVISVQELIATRDTSITFPNRMAISNVDVNFKVKVDIYTMEITPKEVKNSKSTSLASTSKFFSPFKNSLFHSSSDSSSSHGSGSSANSNSNHHYNEHSSLGMSQVGAKTSNFIHIDTIEITNKDLNSNRFKLSISSSSIPLTGVLFVTVRCMPSKSIELKGFMTLLEDVDGLRSWDRRWCFLNNYNISYWKYPEDEYKVSPLGIIDMTKCVSSNVAILPRDMCARKYTFELSIGGGGACDSLADMDKRYRLSADTKDQAHDWLTNVNYALANLKLWNPKTSKKGAGKK